jgi:hypothetical protein
MKQKKGGWRKFRSRAAFFCKKAGIMASIHDESEPRKSTTKRMLFQKFQTLFKSRNAINLCAISAVWLLVSACVFNTARENAPSNSNESANVPENTAKIPETKSNFNQPAKKEDAGDFVVRHLGIKNARFAELDGKIKKEKLLEKAADDLNRAFILPNNIYLHTADCGQVNAEFDPQTQTITICYELMEHFSNLFKGEGIKPAEADKKMFDAVRFAFLHEVGHALIYNFELPVTGNEEDAADRCSSYINIEKLGDAGINAVLAAADAFRIESRQRSSTRRDMSGEHLLEEQRFYNSLCMLYGSNADKYEYFVRDGWLPQERAERCPAEYRRAVDSWTNLLEPWRKGY